MPRALGLNPATKGAYPLGSPNSVSPNAVILLGGCGTAHAQSEPLILDLCSSTTHNFCIALLNTSSPSDFVRSPRRAAHEDWVRLGRDPPMSLLTYLMSFTLHLAHTIWKRISKKNYHGNEDGYSDIPLISFSVGLGYNFSLSPLL